MGNTIPLFPADDTRAVNYAIRQLGNMEAAMIESGTPTARARDILGTAMTRHLAAIIDADPDPLAARLRFEALLTALLEPMVLPMPAPPPPKSAPDPRPRPKWFWTPWTVRTATFREPRP